MHMKKFSSFDRVIGKVSDNEKKKILKEKDEQFKDQNYEEIRDMEI